MRRTLAVVLAVLVAAGMTASCGGGEAGDGRSGPEIVVGSFGFGESEILGEVYAQGLASAGYPVSHHAQIGPREVVKPQLEIGEVGLVPEYVGSALEVGFGGMPNANAEEVRMALATAYEPAGVAVLDLAPVGVTNAFVITQATADEHDISTVSDLAKLGVVSLGGPPECRDRPRCAVGLTTTYELEVEFTALDAGGPLTLAALRAGEIDVGLFFSTLVFDADLVQLEDDRGLQPAENVVPVIRRELIDAYGDDLVARINEISASITKEGLTELNRQFTIEQRDAVAIATDWLKEMGL
jgi:osmoprotectant transport system substrate-binding protein